MYFYIDQSITEWISIIKFDKKGMKANKENISSNMTAIKNIGQVLQERRRHMNITQKQLADMADIGINTLYKIETGQANPTIESLQKIADVLGLEISLQVKKI